MTRDASVATLRRLAEAAAEYCADWKRAENAPSRNRFMDALDRYRSEIAPLRTREQVDAEICSTVRAYYGATMLTGNQGSQYNERLKRLAVEPTRDSGPSSADAEEVPSPPASRVACWGRLTNRAHRDTQSRGMASADLIRSA